MLYNVLLIYCLTCEHFNWNENAIYFTICIFLRKGIVKVWSKLLYKSNRSLSQYMILNAIYDMILISVNNQENITTNVHYE